MAVINTFFKRQKTHMWTWYRWNSEVKDYTNESMIDLTLASRKNLTTDVRAIPSVSLDSDGAGQVVLEDKASRDETKKGASERRIVQG